MSNDLKDQDLIDAFLEAIRLRRLDRCQEILQELETLVYQKSSLKPWSEFLRGQLAFEWHRWAEAESILTELLRNKLKPELRGRVLYTLGRSFDAQGRWEEAMGAFKQTLSIATELGQISEQVRAWKHMAISFHKGFTQGDFGPVVLQQAIKYCQSALDVLGSTTTPTPDDLVWLKGTVWNTLGLIYISLGQWDEAIACYQQDLAICRTLDDRFGIGLSLHNLGEVYQKCGNWSEALAAYQQALSIIREFNNHYEETDVLANIAFLHQEIGASEQALHYYDQAIQVIEDLRAGVSSEAAQAGFFGTVVDIYANAVLLYVKTGQYTQAFDLVERARSRAFLDMLAARSPDLSQKIEVKPMTLTEVQTALPSDTLLLEYFTTGLVEAQEGRIAGHQAERHRFPPAHTLIFAVTHDALQVHNADLSPNDLYPHQFDSVVERHFLEPYIRRSLYNRLIAPLEVLLQGKRRLYIVPHGPLHYIPFQALLAPDGETLLCEGGPQLVYAPSATLLLRNRSQQGQPPPSSCLAIGYNSQGETQLYFAEAEARSVARLTNGRAITGQMTKKAALFSQAVKYRLLHLACHGEFDPDSPLASFLHLAPDETLTALEVLEQLRLHCDLVTLSACESGLSRVRRGDELVGFMRAFMYAGAPALVSTLWRVNDHPTRILMERFYQEIQNEVGFAEALKRAQLYVKNLSYQDALDILASLTDNQTDQTVTTTLPAFEHPPDWPRTGLTLRQATTYLRGVVSRERPNTGGKVPPEPALDEKVFADPYYWAAFILIGPA
jgi:CHAT domain-containing protein/tetratricopeptide (TPR) repeat protein